MGDLIEPLPEWTGIPQMPAPADVNYFVAACARSFTAVRDGTAE